MATLNDARDRRKIKAYVRSPSKKGCVSCGQTPSAAGDDALCCRILFCSYRFGRWEVGRSRRAQNRIMIFPGLLGDNYGAVREENISGRRREYMETQRMLNFTGHMVIRIPLFEASRQVRYRRT